uniref:Uncharacterized protein n=1 Tax=Anopheles atroparvus TaxID=41427 RepID=A0A182IW89_ANOAO
MANLSNFLNLRQSHFRSRDALVLLELLLELLLHLELLAGLDPADERRVLGQVGVILQLGLDQHQIVVLLLVEAELLTSRCLEGRLLELLKLLLLLLTGSELWSARHWKRSGVKLLCGERARADSLSRSALLEAVSSSSSSSSSNSSGPRVPESSLKSSPADDSRSSSYRRSGSRYWKVLVPGMRMYWCPLMMVICV